MSVTNRYGKRQPALRAMGQAAWDQRSVPVKDVVNFLADCLRQRAGSQPSIMLYRGDDYVAGVDFELVGRAPPSRAWCWPRSSARMDDVSASAFHAPRFMDMEGALASAAKALPEAFYCLWRGGDGISDVCGVRVRGFFDDLDYVEEGAARAWWEGQVASARVDEPVAWRGSDDPMDF